MFFRPQADDWSELYIYIYIYICRQTELENICAADCAPGYASTHLDGQLALVAILILGAELIHNASRDSVHGLASCRNEGIGLHVGCHARKIYCEAITDLVMASEAFVEKARGWH